MISRCLKSLQYPSVSIGVPVFNGERYLREALDSLVSQDYPNFEIHVSDNASTDSTWTIIREYAAKNDRFRLHRWGQNVGAVRNFQHVLLDSDTKYFMWAAFDDIWSPDFISKAVAVLEADRSAVMVNANTVLIDEAGNELPEMATRPPLCDMKGVMYADSVKELALRVGWCIYALINRKMLLKTSVFGDQEITHDVILTYELASLGSLRVLQDVSFFYRIVPNSLSDVQAQLQVESDVITKPFSRLFQRCSRVIATSSVSAPERAQASENFLDVCAAHGEWWPALRAENNWPKTPKARRRACLLKELAGEG